MTRNHGTASRKKGPGPRGLWSFVFRVFRGQLLDRSADFFVDFEGSRASGILEFGVAEVQRGKVVSARTRLCRATGEVRAEDVAVHGLRAEALARHAPFADEWSYFSSLRELGPLAAHYAGVENGLLKAAWPYPRNVPDFARPGERIVDWGPWIDTARLYEQLFPRFDSAGWSRWWWRRASSGTGCAGGAALPADRCRYHAAVRCARGSVAATALAPIANRRALDDALLALSTLDRSATLQQRELFWKQRKRRREVGNAVECAAGCQIPITDRHSCSQGEP